MANDQGETRFSSPSTEAKSIALPEASKNSAAICQLW